MTSEKNDAHTINILHFIYYFVAKYNLILNPLLKNAFMGQVEVLKIGNFFGHIKRHFTVFAQV